jgi:parallel beta-helix repeat protein
MAIRDNLGAADPAGSEYGDGIVTFFSAHNRITRNRVVHNGVFDGIAMLGQGSDGNVVLANTVTQTTADNTGGPAGIGILVNPFLSVDLPRNVSDFGNQILGNTVTGNDAAGISTLSNVDGVVADNVVSGNGFHAAPGNGIGVQHLQNAQPDTHELVQGNHVTGNAAEGIDLVADANLVRDNQVHGNGRSGIHSGNRFLGFLGGGPGLNNRITDNDASGNALAAPDPFDPSPPHDLVDEHPDCDANVWLGNIWGPAGFFPDCTSNGGHQAPPASAAAAAAAAPMAHTTAPVPRAQPAANQDPPPRRHPPKPA